MVFDQQHEGREERAEGGVWTHPSIGGGGDGGGPTFFGLPAVILLLLLRLQTRLDPCHLLIFFFLFY